MNHPLSIPINSGEHPSTCSWVIQTHTMIIHHYNTCSSSIQRCIGSQKWQTLQCDNYTHANVWSTLLAECYAAGVWYHNYKRQQLIATHLLYYLQSATGHSQFPVTAPSTPCDIRTATCSFQTASQDLPIFLLLPAHPCMMHLLFFFFFPPYFVHLTGRRHLRSAASGKLYVQQTATATGRRNFAVSGPETWNSLPAELRLSTLSTATFAWRLKAHLFVSTEWHVPAARLILLKAALVINIIIILCGPCNNWHYLGHIKHVDNDDDDDDQFARTNIHAPQGSQMHNNSALNELTTVTQCELTLTRLLRPSAVPVAPSVAAT